MTAAITIESTNEKAYRPLQRIIIDSFAQLYDLQDLAEALRIKDIKPDEVGELILDSHPLESLYIEKVLELFPNLHKISYKNCKIKHISKQEIKAIAKRCLTYKNSFLKSNWSTAKLLDYKKTQPINMDHVEKDMLGLFINLEGCPIETVAGDQETKELWFLSYGLIIKTDNENFKPLQKYAAQRASQYLFSTYWAVQRHRGKILRFLATLGIVTALMLPFKSKTIAKKLLSNNMQSMPGSSLTPIALKTVMYAIAGIYDNSISSFGLWWIIDLIFSSINGGCNWLFLKIDHPDFSWISWLGLSVLKVWLVKEIGQHISSQARGYTYLPNKYLIPYVESTTNV